MLLAHSVCLWLRDLGLELEQIAHALDIAPEAAESLVAIAASPQPDGEVLARDRIDVAVFVDNGDAELLEDAAWLAAQRGATLHVLALCTGNRSLDTLLNVTRRLLGLSVDVHPVAATGSRSAALRSLRETVGIVTVVTNSGSSV